MRLRVTHIDCFEAPYRLRLPFRFGVITVTEGVQAWVRLRVELDNGRSSWGYSAEALAAKWFDKRAHLSDEDNRDQLRLSLQLASEAYLASAALPAFALHAHNYESVLHAAHLLGLPPLVASYGMALLDRAVADALCRAQQVTWSQAVQGNLLELRGDTPLTPDLAGFDVPTWLSTLQPQNTLHVRHTIGLLDPIEAADQAPQERVDDGLPETLQEVVSQYGHRYFKVKVSGQIDADIERLQRIARVLDAISGGYYVTFDGNEQFSDAHAFAHFWQHVLGTPALAQLVRSTLWIEQPIGRQRALQEPVHGIAGETPLVIDESDSQMDSFVRAGALGYQGVSTKSCKGFYKSLLNLARCTQRNSGTKEPWFMSAEDLTMQPGIALQQDMALVSLMGIRHVERNAHHFIDGFNGQPLHDSQAFAAAHPDLYRSNTTSPRLHIVLGQVTLGSVNQALGLGASLTPKVEGMMPMRVMDRSRHF